MSSRGRAAIDPAGGQGYSGAAAVVAAFGRRSGDYEPELASIKKQITLATAAVCATCRAVQPRQ